VTKLTFIQPDAQAVTVDAQNGISVMQAALRAGVEGIFAECGGNLACATCHVFVQAAGSGVGEPSEPERAMLEYTVTPSRAESRLSCQIAVTAEMEGCVFAIAQEQL
jgi:ferredoxin, 2Fe-2S